MGGRSGQSSGGGGGGGGGEGGEGGYQELSNGVLVSKNVNEVKMDHYTTSANKESILKNGFKDGTNNVFGEGVYFTNEVLSGGRFETKVSVNMKNHKQLFVKDDFNVYSEVGKATGASINNGFQIKKAMIDSGYKSMRVKQENGAMWTVVFDKSIIK
jgi:hypothetical protein